MIVVYDVTSGDSFANVKRWLHEIDQNCDVVNRILGKNPWKFSSPPFEIQFAIVVPVGNKDDDPDRKVVLTQDARRFADQMGIQLFETSAKDNINVEEVHKQPTFSCFEGLFSYFNIIEGSEPIAGHMYS